jgi:UDP-N-acetylglucosamine--N-acetylmuramyl-(pentapeptide) pyrophosphoryl-undecaprenol N-acetylglucosamine transferase
MGGSQGAESINQLMIDAAPQLAAKVPTLQFLHLTGPEGMETVRRAYAAGQQKAVVQPFLTEMELALGAATVAVSRAGASSLAELAAMQLPAILIPYPTAADDHQFYNARAFAEAGAARMVGQKTVTPEILAELVTGLVSNEKEREHIREVLRQRHVPDAAARIAERILNVIHEQDAVAGKEIGSGSKTPIELEDTGLKEAPNQKSQPCMMSARPTMDTWNSK